MTHNDKKDTNTCYKLIAQNKRARFDYEILETYEAGLVLMGSEVKSLRLGRSSIQESHVSPLTQENHVALFLFNATIREYSNASVFGHDQKRLRKLLLKKKQMNKLLGAVQRKGMTIVPLSLYFNRKGLVKLSVALAKGRKNFDKREVLKERDWKRQQGRLLKQVD